MRITPTTSSRETILPAVPDPANGGQLTRPEYNYTYDSYGDLLAVTDPLGNTTSYSYDPFSEQLSETLPMGQSDSTEYNIFGQVTRETDYGGQVTEFQYDSFGRPSETLFFTN